MTAQLKKQPSYRRELYQRAIVDSFRKLDPRVEVRNPVMFVVEVGSVLTTRPVDPGPARAGRSARRLHRRGGALAVVHRALRQLRRGRGRRARQGPGRGPAQDAQGDPGQETARSRSATPGSTWCRPIALRKGDVVPGRGDDIIPADGEVVEGIASVDESAVTGESAPVIREAAATAAPSPAARACSPTG